MYQKLPSIIAWHFFTKTIAINSQGKCTFFFYLYEINVVFGTVQYYIYSIQYTVLYIQYIYIYVYMRHIYCICSTVYIFVYIYTHIYTLYIQYHTVPNTSLLTDITITVSMVSEETSKRLKELITSSTTVVKTKMIFFIFTYSLKPSILSAKLSFYRDCSTFLTSIMSEQSFSNY